MCNSSDCIDVRQKDSQLWQRYQREKTKQKMLFPAEGAKLLGVSELVLMLSSPDSLYMGNQCVSVLKQLESFGELLSVVRNDHAVHEKVGVYQNLKINDNMAIMVNVGGLDMRYFIHHWQHMLAVSDTSNPDKPSYSIQFFDEQGNAINKVFLQDTSPNTLARWQAMIDEQVQEANQYVDIESAEYQHADVTPNPWQLNSLTAENAGILHEKWLGMSNIHQFHGILNNLQLDRASSYAQAPQDHAYQIAPNAIEPFFDLVKQHDCPLMTFVSSTGAVQIQTGKINHIKRLGDWINILDKDSTQFTLHLNDVAIKQLWVVKRPTVDGIVTNVEAFDAYGHSIINFFGQRLEGEPELASWKAVTDSLIKDFALPKLKESA